MKKFVHSRWFNECSVPLSPCQSQAVAWYTAFSTPERGEFSGQETPTKVMILQTKTLKTRMGDRGNFKMALGDFVMTGGGRRRLHSGTALNVDRKKFVNERPDATYTELIRGVFEREGKSEMRKCEIIRSLKNRYPYFRTLRRLDSCVGQALRMGSKFVSKSPGVWRYSLSGGKLSNVAARAEQFPSKSFNRRRDRKPPDFYRAQQWSKSTRRPSGNARRKRMIMRRIGREEDEESVSSESNCKSNESNTLASLEVCSNASPETEKNLNEIVKENEKFTVEKLKQQLREFHDNVLKETIAKITQENEKYLQKLISKFHDLKKVTNDEKKPAGISDLEKQNKQVLKEAITEIISQSEKCLEQLASSSVSHFKPARTDAMSLLQQESSAHTATASGFQETNDRIASTTVAARVSGMVSASASANHSQPVISTTKTSSVGLQSSSTLPTKCTHRQRNHVRRGRRIVPRLKSSPFEHSSVRSEEGSDGISLRKRADFAGCNTKTSVDLDGCDRFSEKPSSDLSILKVSSIRKSPDIGPSCSDDRQFTFKTEATTDTSPLQGQGSMDDAFVKFARQNSELDDIIAMIDPTAVSEYGKEKDDAGAVPVTEDKPDKPNSTVVGNTKFPRDKEVRSESVSSGASIVAASDYCDANADHKAPVGTITRESPSATSTKKFDQISDKKNPKVASSSSGNLQDIRRNETNCSASAPKLYCAHPTDSVSRTVFSYRYNPPYEWRLGGVPTNNQACSSSINCRPQMVMDPNATGYLLYSAVRPILPKNSQTMNPAVAFANAPQSLCVSGMAPNDFQCRIQGANIFGFPVLKNNSPSCASFYSLKR